jgi:STE24 endopeptidase
MNGTFTVNAFTYLFLAALLATTGTRLWLAARQSRYVLAHRDAVPESFSGTIPLAAHQKAADYTVAKVKLGMVDMAVDIVVLLALTVWGLLQLLADQWERAFAANSLLHGTALILSVFLIQGIAGMPLSLYGTFVIEERFGFNKMTLRLYLLDMLKSTALAAALGIPFLLVVLWLMQAAGELWWLYVWIAIVGYSVFLQFIGPSFIMPMFNKFSPIEDPALVERVQRLLARCGYRSRGLYVMDGSKRSAHGNAFFSGFGATKRIVLFDTLIDRLLPAEVEAVLAHELGHFKLRHIVKGMLIGWATTLALLFALGFLVDKPWFYAGLGVETPSLAAALVLFLLVTPVFLYFIQPMTKLFSRKNEFEADAFATKHANAEDLVHALVKLYRDNASTLTPDPVHSAFYDSHPPAATRIARLRTA